MGLKLTGEYQLVDDGVMIEGELRGSKIHELSKLFKPFSTITLYSGMNKDGLADKYQVPHPRFRTYLLHQQFLTREDEKEFVRLEGPFSYNGRSYYRDGGAFYMSMGVQYSHGDGRNIVDKKKVMSFTGRTAKTHRLCTNSAWIWNVRSDGTFSIKLRGLANRHMMTMVIGNAAKMANHLQMIAEKVLDKSELFTHEYITEHGGLY